MTSQGSAHGRFSRALKRRNLFAVEMAIRTPMRLLSLSGQTFELIRDRIPELERSAPPRARAREDLTHRQHVQRGVADSRDIALTWASVRHRRLKDFVGLLSRVCVLRA